MNQNTLNIPRIPVLDSLRDAEAISSLMDTECTMTTIANANWPSDFPYKPLAAFNIAYTENNLYVDFVVRCNYLRAENTADLSPVCEDSCVEAFIQPVQGGAYWNFEFNCIGALNASHRFTRSNPTRLSPEELSQIRRYPSCGNRPFREIEGLFAWSILVVIPFSIMGIEKAERGMKLWGNFYKCASATSQPHFLSWAPIATDKPDFHRPEYFVKLILQ